MRPLVVVILHEKPGRLQADADVCSGCEGAVESFSVV